ncbi:MAG: hypothetical protein ACFWUM_05665 [Eubacteriales bacterium]|jgi:hypothetical protein
MGSVAMDQGKAFVLTLAICIGAILTGLGESPVGLRSFVSCGAIGAAGSPTFL